MGMSEIKMFKRYKSDFSKLSLGGGREYPCYNDMIRTEAHYPCLIRSPTIRNTWWVLFCYARFTPPMASWAS